MINHALHRGEQSQKHVLWQITGQYFLSLLFYTATVLKSIVSVSVAATLNLWPTAGGATEK